MPSLDAYVLSLFLGYLLGSIPVAALVSRRRSIDIFSTGTGLSGATNVFFNVGHKSGALVSAGDAAKGALTVVAAQRLGVEDGWILLPAFAAIAGHWRSIFTRFRGGDSLATLLGITIVLLPIYGVAAIGVGTVVGLWFRCTAHPTLWGGFACYGLLLGRALLYRQDMLITFGLEMLALMVLAHAVIGHRRRRSPALPDYDAS